MRSDVYWIQGTWLGRLAIVPRPRGGDWLEDEVGAWRAEGIDILVSALEEEETRELDIRQEASLCHVHGIEFIAFPIPDRGTPASALALVELIQRLERDLEAGKQVAIHCRQGVGRSALLAACLLAATGMNVDAAFERVRAARGCNVPDTAEQREWVRRFSQEPLVRTGEM